MFKTFEIFGQFNVRIERNIILLKLLPFEYNTDAWLHLSEIKKEFKILNNSLLTMMNKA